MDRTCVLRGFALGLAMLAVVGCREVLVDPASGPGRLDISLQVAPQTSDPELGEGARRAFDAADRIAIRVLRQGSVVVEQDQAFSPSSTETRVQVGVDVEEDGASFEVEVELMLAEDPLFSASRSVVMESGETTEAELSLVPVRHAVLIMGQISEPLQALGELLQFEATVLYASGDPVDGAELLWSSSDPAVASVTQNGLVTAVGNGSASIRASSGEVDELAEVEVQQQPGSISVEPAALTLAPEASAQLEAVLADSNGNNIPAGSVQVEWSSDNPGAVAVNATGVVTAMSEGEALITATAGAQGLSATAEVTVQGTLGLATGRVEDAITGQALEGAVVDFGAGRSATSSPEGVFSIQLPGGTYSPGVTADGYQPLDLQPITVTADTSTDLGTLQLYDVDSGAFFGVWAYRELVEIPGVDLPDYTVIIPPTLFWDVDLVENCYVIDEFDGELLGIEDDLWTFRDLETNEEFTYRFTLETPDELILELVDDEFTLTFILDRTSLSLDDFTPRCAGFSELGAEPPANPSSRLSITGPLPPSDG